MNNRSSITRRESISLHLRVFTGWNRLHAEVAGALELPIDQVRGLSEHADPAVRMEVVAFVTGFQAAVELYIDPRRAPIPTPESLAIILAQRLGVDVAHHDGSMNPYAYILTHPTGEQFAVYEIADESDGLRLDETVECMRQLSP